MARQITAVQAREAGERLALAETERPPQFVDYVPADDASGTARPMSNRAPHRVARRAGEPPGRRGHRGGVRSAAGLTSWGRPSRGEPQAAGPLGCCPPPRMPMTAPLVVPMCGV
jgi:hypothetical protein